MPQHAAHVADNRFRRHRTEGNNLRYRITPVHICYMLDNLIAFFHTEVNIEVGHGDTFRVKETFEQQVEFQRVEVGNFQRIGYQRTRTGASPRAYRHTVIFRPLDKFHNDKEVAREPHLVNNLEFNIQTFIILRAFLFTDRLIREKECQTLFQPLFRLRDKKIFGGHIPGRELGQEVLAQTHRDVTTFGDFYRVFERFRDVREKLTHLVFAAHILLRRVITRTLGVIKGKAVVNRDTDFMGVKVARIDKTHVIGRHNRQTAFFGEPYRRMQIVLFVRTTGTNQFEIIVVGEMLFVKRHALLDQRAITAHQAFTNIPHPGTRQQDQPVFQLNQPVAVNPWPRRPVPTLIGTRN